MVQQYRANFPCHFWLIFTAEVCMQLHTMLSWQVEASQFLRHPHCSLFLELLLLSSLTATFYLVRLSIKQCMSMNRDFFSHFTFWTNFPDHVKSSFLPVWTCLVYGLELDTLWRGVVPFVMDSHQHSQKFRHSWQLRVVRNGHDTDTIDICGHCMIYFSTSRNHSHSWIDAKMFLQLLNISNNVKGRLFANLCKMLRKAHAIALLHKDLKPPLLSLGTLREQGWTIELQIEQVAIWTFWAHRSEDTWTIHKMKTPQQVYQLWTIQGLCWLDKWCVTI